MTQVVDYLELMCTVDSWSVVHCICKCLERMNEEILWYETRLSYVVMAKLYCVRD